MFKITPPGSDQAGTAGRRPSTAASAGTDGFTFDLPAGVSEVNSRRGASFSQLDLRISREFPVGPVGIEGIVEVFNAFDEENPGRYIGNRRASNFGQPTVFAGDPLQGEQRLIQLGVRLRY